MLERDAKTAQRLSSGSGSRGDVCFCVSIQRLLKVWQRAHSGHRKPALHVPLWPGLPVETAVADSRPSPSRASESASSAADNAARVDSGLPRCADGQAAAPCVWLCARARVRSPPRPGFCSLSLAPGPRVRCACTKVPSSHAVASSSPPVKYCSHPLPALWLLQDTC